MCTDTKLLDPPHEFKKNWITLPPVIGKNERPSPSNNYIKHNPSCCLMRDLNWGFIQSDSLHLITPSNSQNRIRPYRMCFFLAVRQNPGENTHIIHRLLEQTTSLTVVASNALIVYLYISMVTATPYIHIPVPSRTRVATLSFPGQTFSHISSPFLKVSRWRQVPSTSRNK